MAAACEFDKLFTISVPHILEKIFLSLDFKSFMNCLKVRKSWNQFLTTESFQRRSQPVFHNDIHFELGLAAKRGNVDKVQRILISFIANINCQVERNGTPLSLAASEGHQDVVQHAERGGLGARSVARIRPLFIGLSGGLPGGPLERLVGGAIFS